MRNGSSWPSTCHWRRSTRSSQRLEKSKVSLKIERIEAASAAADAALQEVEPLLFGTLDLAAHRGRCPRRARIPDASSRCRRPELRDDCGRRSGSCGAGRITKLVVAPSSEGDTVVIDVGALVEGYHSDMTRSYVHRRANGTAARHLPKLVQVSQIAGLAALHPGVTATAVDSACRDVFVEAGYADWYLHGTGHGVGLQIHESPFHSQASNDVIQAGNVVDRRAGPLSCRFRWLPH